MERADDLFFEEGSSRMSDHLIHSPTCACCAEDNDPTAARERAMRVTRGSCDTEGCDYEGTLIEISVDIPGISVGEICLCPACVGEARRQLMASPALAEPWR